MRPRNGSTAGEGFQACLVLARADDIEWAAELVAGLDGKVESLIRRERGSCE